MPEERPIATAIPPLRFLSRAAAAFNVCGATGYSLAGLRAACRHEAAFSQEPALGLPFELLAPGC